MTLSEYQQAVYDWLLKENGPLFKGMPERYFMTIKYHYRRRVSDVEGDVGAWAKLVVQEMGKGSVYHYVGCEDQSAEGWQHYHMILASRAAHPVHPKRLCELWRQARKLEPWRCHGELWAADFRYDVPALLKSLEQPSGGAAYLASKAGPGRHLFISRGLKRRVY